MRQPAASRWPGTPGAAVLRPVTSLLATAILLAACTEQVILAPPEQRDPDEVSRTFGTSGHDYALAAGIHSSGIYVVGRTSGALDGPHRGQEDAFIRKYHPQGEVLWADQFGTHLEDAANGVAADAAGNVYVVGHTYGSLAGQRGHVDAFIRRYDAAGTLLWTRQFGSTDEDVARKVAVDAAGNAYVVGITWGALQGTNQGNADAFIRKYSPSGNVLWTSQFGTTGHDFGHGVAVDAAGNAVVAGYTNGALRGTNAGDDDAFVRKFDPTGKVLWTRQFGTDMNDRASAVAVDGTGAIIVAGTTHGNLKGTQAGSGDAFVRKYTADGAHVITRQFGTAMDEIGGGVAVDDEDNYYVVGSTGGDLAGEVGGGDVFIRKYTSGNAVAWTRQFGSTAFDQASAVAVRQSSAIYVAGSTLGTLAGQNRGGYDAFIRRLNSNGLTSWTDQ
jgi:hypothetical protein